MSKSKMAANTKANNRATYTFEDQQRLMQMVVKYAAIIECKKTDKTTWQQKEDAWKKLANEFNSGTNVFKTVTALQSKFRNMKRDYRSCIAKERQSLYATGGGPKDEIAPYPFADSMEQLVELSAKGLVSEFDSDALKDNERDAVKTPEEDGINRKLDASDEEVDIQTQELNDSMENENPESAMWEEDLLTVHEVEDTATDWGKYTTFMLKQPINAALDVSKECTPARRNNPTEKLNEASTSGAKSAQQHKSDGKVNLFKAGKKRPSLKAFQDQKRSASGEKYTALAESKKMLAENQMSLVEKELAMKTEKHDKEMQLLNLKIEAEKINIKIKQLQYSQMKHA